MEWIYFSPHLDDIALSCGGLVWEQSKAGIPVSVWTICAGDPPPDALSPFAEALHARWGTGAETVAHRRLEDMAACAQMGADYRHLQVPDCIYRRGIASRENFYISEADIFGDLRPEEEHLVDQLSTMLTETLPPQAVLVCPLALGGHVDHRLTRALVEKALHTKPNAGWELYYYGDYPYIRSEQQTVADLQQSLVWNVHLHPVSEAGLHAWQRAVAAYASQISTFWVDLETMEADLRSYAQQAGGVRLWQPKKPLDEQAF
jgi:LmbE family N-acetylglucosaminyl deacetylase